MKGKNFFSLNALHSDLANYFSFPERSCPASEMPKCFSCVMGRFPVLRWFKKRVRDCFTG